MCVRKACACCCFFLLCHRRLLSLCLSLSLSLFLLAKREREGEKETIITVFSFFFFFFSLSLARSLSLSLYTQCNDGRSHCAVRAPKEGERETESGRTHSLFFRIERAARFACSRRRERVRREREKRIIMRRRMFNRGQNKRKSLLASSLSLSIP